MPQDLLFYVTNFRALGLLTLAFEDTCCSQASTELLQIKAASNIKGPLSFDARPRIHKNLLAKQDFNKASATRGH